MGMRMVERNFSLAELKEKKEAGYAYYVSNEDSWEFLTAKEKTKRQVREFWNNIDLILEEEDEFDITETFRKWIEEDDLYTYLDSAIATLEAAEER